MFVHFLSQPFVVLKIVSKMDSYPVIFNKKYYVVVEKDEDGKLISGLTKFHVEFSKPQGNF